MLTRFLLRGAASFALIVSAVPAQACRGGLFERSILLPDLEGVKAPLAMQVTITKMIKNGVVKPDVHVPQEQYEEHFTQIGLARVEKVVRGEFKEPFVLIAVLPTSCGPGIQAGLSGVVAGKLERRRDGATVFRPVSESEYMRQNGHRAGGF